MELTLIGQIGVLSGQAEAREKGDCKKREFFEVVKEVACPILYQKVAPDSIPENRKSVPSSLKKGPSLL
jgi:hypothetical protein